MSPTSPTTPDASSVSPLRKRLAVGVVGILTLGAGAGLIAAPSAMAQEPGPAPTQEQIDQRLARLADAVENGRISQERADAIAERLESGDFANLRGHRAPRGLRAAVEASGLDAETVRAGLTNGQSLAEIIEANGGSTEAVLDQMIAAATERIEAKVTEGRIDADRAAEILGRLEDRFTALLNRVPGERAPA